MSSKLKLGKFDIKTEISGISLTLPTELSIQIETVEDKVILTTDSLIDLTELQTNFLQIIKGTPISQNSGYGIKVEINSFDSAALSSIGDSALLEVGISCGVWDIQPGVVTTVTRYTTVCKTFPWPLSEICSKVADGVDSIIGEDVKLHLFNEGLSAKIRFGLTTPDNKVIDIQQYETEVYPRGELGKFTNWLLSFVKGDLSHFAKGQLQKIINDGTIRQTFPKNLDKYNPLIKTIQFITLSTGNLGVLASFEASLTEDELTDIISKSIEN